MKNKGNTVNKGSDKKSMSINFETYFHSLNEEYSHFLFNTFWTKYFVLI